ncbi:hypothetical protein HCY47_03245 [Limosilactobacillus fermentum]|jgi:preprotein translocase subunit SecB|uniref:Preprotein translocase subunit SecB n=1 Tax=Limosilactobacillus fermentum TaxID=1613 RepID=A0A2K2TGH8_LIMFE|nr:protein-export chaperone SecB [Limosilactobacillus fermentum]MCT3437622.1 hypothetical protein [Limosilactobacillus fermentum]MCT3442378.1 hypothetical protein [Limosilactobacillus fermentum]MCT3452251.1 hypothetical protein [Limosilactobacillus fermentum]PNV57038.1 hypothetical protein C1Y38_10725 [Limosilactobacillus fermentum]SPE16686.1 preprotein translocase subunit SecB [Limosilactobacillus fermentum]
MVVLEFKGYHILKMEYERNLKFNSKEDEASFNPNINISFHKNSDKEANVVLGFSSKDELPFNVDVQIEGMFKYNAEEDEAKLGLDNLLKKNATAILFPYFRMVISQLTGMSGEYPALVLPTMNIGNLIDRQDKEQYIK